MKKIFAIFLIVIFAAVYFFLAGNYSIYGNKIRTISLRGHTFRVEIVSSPDKIQKGLGNRNSLCQSCAMLFQFPEAGKYPFWMAGMRFPLDIIWIKDGKIVYIEKNVSKDYIGSIIPLSEANQVLEINAGLSDKIGIEPGNEVY
jgi:uncharacterized membrane protein (UPF0127 family)